MGTRPHRVFFSCAACCLVVFVASTPAMARQDPTSTMDPATREYVRWLITGTGTTVPPPPSALSTVPMASEDHEHIGDLQTEIEYYKRTNPVSGRWPLEQRVAAHDQSQLMSEDLDPGQRSLPAPPTQWTLRGPIGMEHRCVADMYWSGRVTCMDYSPTRGMYLGTVGGGLWAPLVFFFVPVTENFPTQTAGGIAINPATPDILFYGTGDYGTQMGGNGTGTYRSVDAGAHWTKMAISPTPSMTSRVIIAPWDYDVVFVAGDAGIFKSTNSGGSWTRTAMWDASDISSNTTGSAMLAGRAGVGVYRSTDQGDTWLPLSTGLPSSYASYIRVEIAKDNPARAYVVMGRPGINGDPLGTGQVRGVYRTDNLLSPSVIWWDITPSSLGTYGYMYGQGWYHNALAVDPTNSSNFFIGGGALMKSTNAGVDWYQVMTYPHADIKVLFFRPGDNLLYGGGDGGVFTSSDLGTSWSPILNRLLPTTLFYNIDVARSNNDVVFGASQDNSTEGTYPGARNIWRVSNIADGIDASIDWSNEATVFTTTQYGDVFRTTTGGSNCPQWPWLNGALKKTSWSAYMFQDPIAANWIYYNGGKYVYYSSDKGSTWPGTINTDSLGGVVIRIAVNSDGNHVYAVTTTTSERLNRFRWTGSVGSPSWEYTNISSGTPPLIPAKIVPSLSAPGRAYALFNGGSSTERIYRTTNNGTAWSNVTGNFTSGIPVHDIVESPYNADVLWIGTDLGVYKSTTGGSTWWWWNKGMPDAVVVNDMEYAYAASGDYIVAGTFGRSTFERDVNAPVYAYAGIGSTKGPFGFSAVGDFVLASADSGRIARSTDKGSSWSTITFPSPTKLFDIHAFDSLRFLVLGQFGGIYRTTDGGQQWMQANVPTQSDLRRFAFLTDQHGFAAGDGGALVETNDGGQTWTVPGQGLVGSFFDITFTGPLTGFIVGRTPDPVPQRLLLRTTDGGQSWIPDQNVAQAGSFFDITFSDALHGFCLGDNGYALRTVNGGQTWNPVNMPTGQSMLGSFFTDPEHGWACGAGGTILSTSDGGGTWEGGETGITDTLFAVICVDGTLLAGGGGGVLSRSIAQRTSMQFAFEDRWNMLSVPMNLTDYATTTVFPTAASQAFSYQGQYVPQTMLSNGPGFWLKFNGSTLVTMNGFPFNRAIIDVATGWNMIGSIAQSLPVDDVLQEPAGIVGSRYFGFGNSIGYFSASSIEPSQAYWVKANQDGRLILDVANVHLSDSAGGPTLRAQRDRKLIDASNSLTIIDGKGSRQTLYYSVRVEDAQLLEEYALPPAPPAGIFNARFGTGQLIESPDERSGRAIPIVIQSALYPLTIHWKERQTGPSATLLIDGKGIVLRDEGQVRVTQDQRLISLELQPGIQLQVPAEFSLEHNYPNPFNPATTIRFGLPEAAQVEVKIFNTLGQEVALIVKALLDAGYHETRFDAAAFSSGVYYYRLEATSVSTSGKSFTQVRKMILVK
jgi:photosystem II stability/assembly factor-like uncharacterized protein